MFKRVTIIDTFIHPDSGASAISLAQILTLLSAADCNAAKFAIPSTANPATAHRDAHSRTDARTNDKADTQSYWEPNTKALS